MNNRLPGAHRRLIIGYPIAVLLVLIYLNMFPVVSYIVQNWGTAPVLVLPILITLIALAVILSLFLKTNQFRQPRAKIVSITVGIIICLAALAVPDPQAPVKRIHVIEYMLLSLLIRYIMSVRHQGIPLLAFSIFFASLLGVHDELLQGLHPLRTYGVRDITVNALGSVGGGLIWHGFNLFEQTGETVKRTGKSYGFSYFYLTWLFCSVVTFFVPLYFFREKTLPIWPAVPLMASIILFAAGGRKIAPRFDHGTMAVSYASFFLLAYLIAARLGPFTFY